MRTGNSHAGMNETTEETGRQRLSSARAPESPGVSRRGRKHWAAALAVLAIGGGVAAAACAGAFTGPAHSAGGVGLYPLSTQTVTRQSLSQQTEVSASLGYEGSYTVRAQGGGTITWLPAAGQVIGQGRALYEVDNGSPVYLLYGTVPAWRTLLAGMSGADVAQLNHDLVALGYGSSTELDADWDYFGGLTVVALDSLQAHLGLAVTGTLPLGQAVFLPSAIRVTSLVASLGLPASGPVLQASSTVQVVTISLSTGQRADVSDGDPVTITLPDGSTTQGTISSVGTVAQSTSSGPVITVEVTLNSQNAADGLDQAPVEVAITTGSVSSALVVPVNALLAQAGGDYAVEVTGPGGRHLVPVTPGLFDDAEGLVQVSGAGLSPGQHVVVPSP